MLYYIQDTNIKCGANTEHELNSICLKNGEIYFSADLDLLNFLFEI